MKNPRAKSLVWARAFHRSSNSRYRVTLVLSCVAVVGAGLGGAGGLVKPSSASFTPPDPTVITDFSGPQYPVGPNGNYVVHDPGTGTSFYLRPFNGYLQTMPATTLLKGVGLDFALIPGLTPDVEMNVMGQAGVRSLRLGSAMRYMNLTETAYADPGLAAQLAACLKYHIRPIITLNADSNVPENLNLVTPSITPKLTAPYTSGDTTIHLSSVDGMYYRTKATMGTVTPQSGISLVGSNPNNLQPPGGMWPAAGSLFTMVTPASHPVPRAGVAVPAGTGPVTVTLSKPLPVSLKAGDTVQVDTLKHLPLYPTGTPEFIDSTQAWLRYANAMTAFVAASGIGSFDVETWNEYTFGSEWLNIDAYYTPNLVPNFHSRNVFKGGPAFEMQVPAISSIKTRYGPNIHVIWGYSNTHFGDSTLTSSLPPGTEGQSYHPYKTNTFTIPSPWHPIRLPTDQTFPRTESQLERFLLPVPLGISLTYPEGMSPTGIWPENIIRNVMAPGTVRDTPADWPKSVLKSDPVTHFYQYMTEDGESGQELGLKTAPATDAYHARAALRQYLFWMNKGLDALDMFTSYDGLQAKNGWGLMGTIPAQNYINVANGTAPLSSALALPMQAIYNMTQAFQPSGQLKTSRQLSVNVNAIGKQYDAFAHATGTIDPLTLRQSSTPPAPLWYRDLYTFLPFQVSDHKFIAAAYVMGIDLVHPLPFPAMGFITKVEGVDGNSAVVSLYDPLTGKTIPAPILAHDATSVSIGVSAVDYPRLIIVDDTPHHSPQRGRAPSPSSESGFVAVRPRKFWASVPS